MAIDINELNEWINGDEGRQWGDEYKSALLKNRDSLLSELKTANGRLSETQQRLVQTENELSGEKAALSKILIDDQLADLLSKCNVFEGLIPSAVKAIKEGNALTVSVSDDGTRQVVGKMRDQKDGAEISASMADIVTAWAENKVNWSMIRNNSTGGGAPGSGRVPASIPKNLGGLSGRALAGVSDADFKAWAQQEISKET